MGNADAVALAEAAWNVDIDEGAWLTGLAEAVGRYLRAPQGVVALRVHANQWSAGNGLEVSAVGSWRLTDLAMNTITALSQRPITLEEHRALSRAGVVATVRHTLGSVGPEGGRFIDVLRDGGAEDCMFLTVGDPSGVMLSIDVPSDVPIAMSRALRWTLSRAAAHMAASDRMRGRGGLDGAIDQGADAVLAPDGRVLDARDDARERGVRDALREAAVRADRSRGRIRRSDPDGALDLWTALVSGRWSLVDRFDTDGRRFIVARRNEPEAEAALALSPRESDVVRLAAVGHGNKLIAYELGITASSVASHLGNAMAKLGVANRAELITVIEAIRAGARP